MSPEQLGLAGGDVTLKSDIYSFGLVLAEALRGRPIDMSGSQAEVIEKRRAIPDLADIDPSIRPLIEAMLQPLPANRPQNMAAIAAWEAPGKAGLVLPRAGAGKAAPARKPAGGRAATILGVLIALGSIAGAAYVFRDDLGLWGQSIFSSTAPVTHAVNPPPIAPTAPAPPPLQATAEPPAQPAGQAAAPPSAAPSPSEPASLPTQHVPTSAELVDAMPPHAPQASVDLPPATVGALYRAELPAFIDQAGKGLRLAAGSAPDGMAFKDLGGGRSAIEGTPTQAGSAAMQVVATNHNGMTAEMTARIAISDRAQAATPPASRPAAAKSAARPEQPEQPPNPSVAHPPAKPSPKSPPPPALPSLPQLAPTPAPQAAPAIAAAPPPPPAAAPPSSPAPAPQVQAAPPSPPAAAPQTAPALRRRISRCPRSSQLRRYRRSTRRKPWSAASTAATVSSSSRWRAPATRTRIWPSAANWGPSSVSISAYTSEVGAEPQLSLRLITPPQCPAIDLIRLGTAAGAAAPRIELANYTVGKGKPLAGTIANLGGRSLVLVLVGDDGLAYRLEAKPSPERDAATFDVPLTPDASSIGPMQILLAIVSAKPIPALESFRSGPLNTIAPQLVGEARSGAVAVGADFFKFVE